MLKVLITGVAGFIGSHVAKHCLDMGIEVVGIDDLSGGFQENIPKRTKFIKMSINDEKAIATLFEEKQFDFVYHLAAYAAEGLSHFIRRFNYTNNLLGSVNLINAAIRTKVKCFIFTSSIAVYGKNQLPMTEDLEPRPEDPYGIAKYAVELDLRAAREMFGLNYIIFRPHNVYGENQNIADKYRNVVGIFMNQVLKKQPMTIFGDGLQTRAFSYIDDVAPIIAQAPMISGAYNEVFNVGADTPCTVLELAYEVSRAFQTKAEIVHLPPRSEVVHAYCSHEKLRRVFPGSNRTTPLREGIEKMAHWVKKFGARTPVEFNNIEVYEKLPASWRN
jgi:UDP-glucose 4-epimerase